MRFNVVVVVVLLILLFIAGAAVFTYFRIKAKNIPPQVTVVTESETENQEEVETQEQPPMTPVPAPSPITFKRLSISKESFAEHLNLEIFEADSERSAVRISSKEKPNIVLLELQLPKMNGIKTSKLIKEVSPDTKIVIVSMYDTEKFQKNFISEHIDDFIGKNEFDGKLVRILRKHLR